MWVVKYGGTTEYVNHVDFYDISFSTKETPDNPKTKGSLKFKNVLLTLDNGSAIVKGIKNE
jgi:hypothetical protein